MAGKKLVTMIEIAMMAAIAIVLHKLMIPFHLWPNGGSVTFSMVPIAAVAFRRGAKAGVICGGITGLLLWMLGGTVIHPAQAVLDYPLAFGALGVAGWVRIGEATKKPLLFLSLCLLVSGGLRLTAHFLSGVIFFKAFTPAGQSVYLYSLVYNLSYVLPEVILTFLIMAGICRSAPQLIRRQG